MEAANLAAKILGGAISLISSVMGVRAAQDMVEEIMKKMVAEGRAPTEAEMDIVFGVVQSRSDRIQGA